jgi:hypothetical protein
MAYYSITAAMLLETGSEHIRKGSRYDGYIEEVTDRIAARLDPRTRKLYEVSNTTWVPQSDVKGVEIYNAVLEHGIITARISFSGERKTRKRHFRMDAVNA